MKADALAVGSRKSDAPLVRGEGLSVAYRKKTVLDVDVIELASGKTYCLLGASGAGKSTLLRVLGMLEKPTTGRVLFDGVEGDRHSLSMRRRVAAVFQKPYLLRGTVGDNVAYGLRLRSVGADERAKRVSAVLARMGMDGWQERSALTLSGGEAQRVALARALVLEPDLLLLDEPLSYIDPLLKRQLSLEFADILASEHVTTLYVTHDRDEAAVVADCMGVMRDGRIVSEGAPEVVLALPPDPWVANFVGAETPIEGVVASNDGGVVRVDCGDDHIFAMGDFEVGTPVVVGVRPEDVLLFEPDVELPKSAARNQIAGVVEHVSADGAMKRVVVTNGCLRFASTVSRLSASVLDLAVGSRVKLIFKASVVRIRPIRPTADAQE